MALIGQIPRRQTEGGIVTAESLNYARQYLRKARDYLASAQDNLGVGNARK